jgi:hypothetical protein
MHHAVLRGTLFRLQQEDPESWLVLHVKCVSWLAGLYKDVAARAICMRHTRLAGSYVR